MASEPPELPAAERIDCDMLVIGSGAAGLTAAIIADEAGLDVIIAEKTSYYGGTTALSGGFAWLPCNPHAAAAGIVDSPEMAIEYLTREAGNFFNRERVEAFVTHAGPMLSAIEAASEMRFFLAPDFPDYHPSSPGGMSGGRSLGSEPYHGRELGAHFKQMRRPLSQITFFGMFLGSGQEIQHYFNITRSLTSASFVIRRTLGHVFDLLRFGRGAKLTQGGAMIARLARTIFDRRIRLWLDCPAMSLIGDSSRVTGAILRRDGKLIEVHARRGVLLASGGFPGDSVRRAQVFAHAAAGAEHGSVALPSNIGDGAALAEAIGGVFSKAVRTPAPMLPVSVIPGKRGNEAFFPHLTDRTKPGIIAVLRSGRRFVNEADSYHDFAVAMLEAGGAHPEAFMVADRRALGRYGLGFAKPFPIPHGHLIRSGYLISARTIRGLAEKAGIDPDTFEDTISRFNTDAVQGKDSAFGKGSSSYNRYQGDARHRPNPCVAPLVKPPFYAVRLIPGDIGSYAGLRTDGRARVLDGEGAPIIGLYAAGADSISMGGGSYAGAGANIGPAMTFGFIAARDMASLHDRHQKPTGTPSE
jgi:hypothetical protein